VFVSGPSGSGKSLLLRALADLDPHEGEAWLDGTACSSLPAPDWRRRVALLPAESFWWFDQVGDHFDRAPPSGTGTRRGVGCAAPAAEAGQIIPALLDRLGFTPEVLAWTVSRLSTGERQRLALARLLALRAPGAAARRGHRQPGPVQSRPGRGPDPGLSPRAGRRRALGEP
jgi:putative ABC transport system ATP-binding protein